MYDIRLFAIIYLYLFILNGVLYYYDCVSTRIFRRTFIGYYADGMHVNFKENLI